MIPDSSKVNEFYSSILNKRVRVFLLNSRLICGTLKDFDSEGLILHNFHGSPILVNRRGIEGVSLDVPRAGNSKQSDELNGAPA